MWLASLFDTTNAIAINFALTGSVLQGSFSPVSILAMPLRQYCSVAKLEKE